MSPPPPPPSDGDGASWGDGAWRAAAKSSAELEVAYGAMLQRALQLSAERDRMRRAGVELGETLVGLADPAKAKKVRVFLPALLRGLASEIAGQTCPYLVIWVNQQ